jgi:hypothetical protein
MTDHHFEAKLYAHNQSIDGDDAEVVTNKDFVPLSGRVDTVEEQLDGIDDALTAILGD